MSGKLRETLKKHHDNLVAIIKRRDTDFWTEAEELYWLKKDENYKQLFGDDSWRSYLRGLPNSMPPSTADMLVRLHAFWVVEKKIPIETLKNVHTRKLDQAIPYLLKKEFTVKDILEKAQERNFDDFIIYLKGDEEPCWHPKEHRKKTKKDVEICGDCGKEIRKPKSDAKH